MDGGAARTGADIRAGDRDPKLYHLYHKHNRQNPVFLPTSAPFIPEATEGLPVDGVFDQGLNVWSRSKMYSTPVLPPFLQHLPEASQQIAELLGGRFIG